MAIIGAKPKEKEILGKWHYGDPRSWFVQDRILVKQFLLKFDSDSTFQKH